MLLLIAAPSAQAHASTNWTFFNGEEGFAKENAQTNSEVKWDSDLGRIDVLSDRRDTSDELYKRALPTQLTTGISFTIKGRWQATTQGNWQGAWPLFVGKNTVDGDPRTYLQNEVVGFRYDSRDSNGLNPQKPHYVMHFRDAGGNLRIDKDFTGNQNTEYHFYLYYNAASKVLTMKIRDSGDTDLSTATYTIGTNNNDGFTLDKIGVASDAMDVDTNEPVARGWADNLQVHEFKAPQNPAATAGPGAGEIKLTWQGPTGHDTGLVGYRIYRGTVAGGETLLTSVGGTTTAWTDTGLPNGATRFYKVTADNGAEESPYSTEVSAVTFSPPGAPRTLSATRGPGIGEIQLSWLAPLADGGTAVTNYKIFRGTTAGGETFLGQVGNVLTWTDTGLPNGATRFYKVSAVNLAGEGGQSSEANAITFDVPTVPRNLGASRGPGVGEITLTWQAPLNDGGKAVTGYKVYRATSSGAESFLTDVGAVLTWKDSAQAAGEERYYKLSAVNVVGEGALGNEANSHAPTVALAPQNLVGTNGPGLGQISLTWQTPADNGGNTITGYKVYRGAASGQLVFHRDLGAVTSFTDTGVPNGATRFYKVTAVNGVGEGAASNEANAMAPTNPSAVQALSAQAGTLPSVYQIKLTWQAPAFNGGVGLTNYRIYRSTTPGAEVFYKQVGNVLTFTDDFTQPLNPIDPVLKAYYYKVGAVNGAGLEGPPSNESCAVANPWNVVPQVGPFQRCE